MTPRGTPNVLFNGLSIGSGGGYTVGRDLLRFTALDKPEWDIAMILCAGDRLHEEIRDETLPPNASIVWAPPAALSREGRFFFEKTQISKVIAEHRFNCIVQLNGMIATKAVPTIAHFQDPWPYRSEAWTRGFDRILAAMKRLAHQRSLHLAAACGFTSDYLRTLICTHHSFRPPDTEVLYNGLPETWIERSRLKIGPHTGHQREPMLLSVSNVGVYKRQELVIRALPAVRRQQSLSNLSYHIAGEVQPAYKAHLEQVASECGVAEAVVIEGRVSDDRVRELYQQASALVQMSVCESFGLPLIEAMSFGLPVIASDCCALPEVCGGAAVLSPPDELEPLADNIVRVLSDDHRAAEMARKGLENVRRFRWAETAEKLAAMILRVSRRTA